MNKQIYQEPTISVYAEYTDVIRTSSHEGEEVGVTWKTYWEEE